MRDHIQLFENEYISDHIKPTPEFVAAVAKRLKTGGFFDYDMPDDPEEFQDDVEWAIFRVSGNTIFRGGMLTIYRAEHRPAAKQFPSVGLFWAYRPENARAIYGADHGHEVHGEDAKLIDVMFTAQAPFASVNWVSTIAANMAMREEKEITMKQGSTVTITEVRVKGRAMKVNMPTRIDNLTQYDESVELDEVERGGYIDDSDFLDDMHTKDLSSDQLDLFKSAPTGEPNLPPNYKLVGKQGEFYIARKLDEDKGKYAFIWILDGKAASYICLVPWSRELMNYPGNAFYKPELNGKGARVASVFVREEYRGKKLGLAMYKWCLENMVDYLMADEMHTTGGEQLWKLMRRTKPFHVEVWDGDKSTTRKRKNGKDFDHVYNVNHLIPWVTLVSKLDKVLSDPYED